ncbi:MAG: hypothetical protein ABIO70_18895, partial [Pseudomonadota bacterium]
PRGVLAAQLIHAAGESRSGALPPGTHAVVLAARDEVHLEAIARRLAFDGLAHVQIREPDPPYLGALMAIGLHPLPGARRVEALRRLRLLA